jgi:hypothetical protein
MKTRGFCHYCDANSAACGCYFSNCLKPSVRMMSSPAPQHSISKKVFPESGTDAGEGGTELAGGTVLIGGTEL